MRELVSSIAMAVAELTTPVGTGANVLFVMNDATGNAVGATYPQITAVMCDTANASADRRRIAPIPSGGTSVRCFLHAGTAWGRFLVSSVGRFIAQAQHSSAPSFGILTPRLRFEIFPPGDNLSALCAL